FLLFSHILFLLTETAPTQSRPSFPTRRSSDLRPRHGAGSPGESGSHSSNRACRLFRIFIVASPLLPGADRLGRRAGRSSDIRKTDRKSTRLNSSHVAISYAVFCLKKKTTQSSS